MLLSRSSWLALLLALASLVFADDALASTKCLCNNGTVTHSMSDAADACSDACDTFGGGRTWVPEDAAYEDGDDVVRTDPAARRIRSQAPAAQRPGRGR